MTRTAPVIAARAQPMLPASDSYRTLLRELLVLAGPVLLEHTLHILVGWNDTYLANHFHRYDVPSELTRADEVAAGAAVGTIAYVMWFIGLLVGVVGTGSTAIIARAVGARHRRLANSICGQSVSAAGVMGIAAGLAMFIFAGPIAGLAGLSGRAHDFAHEFLRILAVAMPFMMVLFIANSCLRGAGDTVTPAITMIGVDVVNIACTFTLTFGWLGLPRMGFLGIALGTTMAYVMGGVVQFVVLVRGRGGIRLHLHRMRPHWHNLKRLMRIGLPAGAEGLLQWLANFVIIRMVNQMGAVAGNAHNIAIRVEAVSFMMGFAVATAATTMVGQSLGMGSPRRASRSAMLAFGVGGGIMTLAGFGFVFFGRLPARLFTEDPTVENLATLCLFIAGFVQCGFAAAMIFGGALRGAGDTFMVMIVNLASIFGVRLAGVIIAASWLKMGLAAVWVVLCVELMVRGALMYGRFLQGAWKKIQV